MTRTQFPKNLVPFPVNYKTGIYFIHKLYWYNMHVHWKLIFIRHFGVIYPWSNSQKNPFMKNKLSYGTSKRILISVRNWNEWPTTFWFDGVHYANNVIFLSVYCVQDFCIISLLPCCPSLLFLPFNLPCVTYAALLKCNLASTCSGGSIHCV